MSLRLAVTFVEMPGQYLYNIMQVIGHAENLLAVPDMPDCISFLRRPTQGWKDSSFGRF